MTYFSIPVFLSDIPFQIFFDFLGFAVSYVFFFSELSSQILYCYEALLFMTLRRNFDEICMRSFFSYLAFIVFFASLSSIIRSFHSCFVCVYLPSVLIVFMSVFLYSDHYSSSVFSYFSSVFTQFQLNFVILEIFFRVFWIIVLHMKIDLIYFSTQFPTFLFRNSIQFIRLFLRKNKVYLYVKLNSRTKI